MSKKEELTYLILTPYTIRKSRTGGIIARLLSRTDLQLIAIQMLTPSKEFAEQYAVSVKKTVGERDERAGNLLNNYINTTFSPDKNGKKHRIMVLLFKGINATEKLFDIVGHIFPESIQESELVTGETIRDTYADLVIEEKDNSIKYFEPAVLTPPRQDLAINKLKLIADFAEDENNIVENTEATDTTEQTLVIIKPDNWRHPSTKPGNIIDMLSRTGLRIVGAKIHRMTVKDALEFYGPVKNALRKKIAPKIGEKAKEILEKELNIKLKDSICNDLTKCVGESFADNQYNQIIEFMSGYKPNDVGDNLQQSKVKCMIMIYEGKNAIQKIRDVLGPTDPLQAPSGTVRKDFGSNVMVNTAHASDSPTSVEREKKIIKMSQNRLSEIIKEFLTKGD